jgi:cytochrome P450
MLAGYETTSTALAFATHVLATHPDEQESLYAELMSEFDSIDVNHV